MQPEGSIMEVCHIVCDIDHAVAHWTEVLGAGPFYVFDVPPMAGQMNRGVPSAIALRIAFGFSGGLLIELLQQLDDGPSVFREILDRRGEGFHHVLLRRDFDSGRAHLEQHGYAMAFSGSLPSGERFALFDTTAGNGGFVELMDFTPASFGPVGKIHDAHVAWDHVTRPRRDSAELFAD